MNNCAYALRELRFRYPGTGAGNSGEGRLEIPELDIEQGLITVIRGHNGSGKTTLLKLIAGLLKPESGRIGNPAGLKAVLVQQDPYLFHGTVQNNLQAPLRFRGLHSGGEDMIKEGLSLVGLEGFEKRKARELSGGEQKRVAIARAMMAGADALLLDEPDVHVDAASSAELENLIRSLKEGSKTVILCSHRKGFAYRTADRIVDLYRGRPADHDENIFKGRYIHSETPHSRFISGDLELICPSRHGRYRTAVVPPENISLTREKKDGQTGNRLAGVLESIQPCKEGRFTLLLNCGGLFLKVRMSGSEIGLRAYRPGEALQLVFSPSAVRLY